MIRKIQIDGVEMYYDSKRVNEHEAEEVLKADIAAAKKYFEGKWPKESWYKEEQVPIYEEVTYILTDRGWLSDKQRADIIRQGNSSSDYEIIEPMQSKTKKEISGYKTEKVFGGCTDASLNRAVQMYWISTGKSFTGARVLVESKYEGNKPFEYMTDDELTNALEQARANDCYSNIVSAVGQDKVDEILEELAHLDDLY